MRTLRFLCLSLFLVPLLAFAQQMPTPPALAAKSWLLIESSSGQVLASQAADERLEPASLTKLMTAYLTFSAIKQGTIKLDQAIPVSERAWRAQGSRMFIQVGTQVVVEDLIKGMIVQSGNDACVALAEAIAGSEDNFAQMMNREAQRLGMKNSSFRNAAGMPDPQHYTTASDLAKLTSALIRDFPAEYAKYYSIKEFRYNKITQPNRNRLLWLDPTVDGMKTGHTEAAGYCMIASARRPGGTGERRLISVVLGTTSDQARTQESQKLLNWGFQNFDTVKLYSKGQAVATPEVWKGSKSTVKIGFARDVLVTVPKGTAAKMKPVLERKDPLVAPLAENAPVGKLKMMVDDKVLLELPVVALETINQATIFGRAWDSMRLWMK